MAAQGWQKLLAGYPWFEGEGNYPIAAYSEFMPPPRVGRKPYGSIDHGLYREDDPFGWHVTEYEEALELQPGLEMIAKELMHVVHHLGCGDPAHGIARKKLDGNPYWPDDLETSGAPQHERYVLLLPLALSKTQDDKGRVRWTLFGGSEQGPAKAFWKSFYTRTAAGSAAGVVRRLHPPPAGRGLRREAGSPRRSSQGGLPRLHESGRRAAALHGKKSRCPSGPSPIAGKRVRSAASATC